MRYIDTPYDARERFYTNYREIRKEARRHRMTDRRLNEQRQWDQELAACRACDDIRARWYGRGQ